MKIVHRIVIRSNPAIQAELAALGVAVADSGIVAFEVDESSVGWPALSEWVEQRGALDQVGASFSPEDLSQADYLQAVPEWVCGYPQPSQGDFGYLKATYDLRQWCETCGCGKKQCAPFQMSGEPKWGRRAVGVLHWVFDEYSCH